MQSFDEYISKAQENYPGYELRLISLPTGKLVVIRSQDGDDDAIITSAMGSAAAQLSLPISTLVAAVVAYDPEAENPSKIPTLDEVRNYPVRDKYTILIQSRIFSLGDEVKFEYNWGNGIKAEYVENLHKFIWDYSIPFPEKGSDDYDENRMEPYPLVPAKTSDFLYFTLNVDRAAKLSEPNPEEKKSIRFKLFNSVGEEYLAVENQNSIKINTRFTARHLEVFLNGKFVKAENFKVFSAKEMALLRGVIAKYDKEFMGLTEVEHPTDPSQINYLQILKQPDFFFHTETL